MSKVEPMLSCQICQPIRGERAGKMVAGELQIAGAEDRVAWQEVGAARQR